MKLDHAQVDAPIDAPIGAPVADVPPPSRRHRIRAVLLGAVLLAAVAFGVVAAIRSGGREAAEVLLRRQSLPAVAAAFAVSAGGLLLATASWRRLLTDAGARVSWTDGARIYFVGLLGKFVPGPVWGVVAHIQIGRSLGISAGTMTSAFFVNLGITTLAGTTVGLLVAPAVLGGRAVLLVVPALATLIFLVRPDLVGRLVDLALRIGRRPASTGASPRAVRASIALNIASWLVYGLHLWIIALLLGARGVRVLPVCVGAFALAAIAGGFAVIMPDGWGARELVITLALATVLPWPVAAVASLASRILVLLVELSGAALSIALAQVRNRRTALPSIPVPGPLTGVDARDSSRLIS